MSSNNDSSSEDPVPDTSSPAESSPDTHLTLPPIVTRPNLSELRQHRQLGNNKAHSHVYHISPDRVAKTGPRVTPGEASALRLAHERGIPVPTVHDVYQDPETGWWVLVLSHISGDILDEEWDVLAPDEKQSIFASLKTITTTLRSTKPSRCISSVDLAGITDSLFLPRYSGPFINETEFVQALIQSLSARQEGPWMQLLEKLLLAMRDHGGEFVFTHGRLNPQNVLVKGGEVVGVLDWGEAGFYPRYWETAKAAFWQADLEFFLEALERGVLERWMWELGVMLHVRDVVF
ncbi:kinase-like domain-containing protein [Coniochaeta sp. 2T2.1]|nr:kinase-like domain-containing protein [Coniochaeta sp. 2T2.1]